MWLSLSLVKTQFTRRKQISKSFPLESLSLSLLCSFSNENKNAFFQWINFFKLSPTQKKGKCIPSIERARERARVRESKDKPLPPPRGFFFNKKVIIFFGLLCLVLPLMTSVHRARRRPFFWFHEQQQKTTKDNK